jgi:hypothetical protein
VVFAKAFSRKQFLKIRTYKPQQYASSTSYTDSLVLAQSVQQATTCLADGSMRDGLLPCQMLETTGPTEDDVLHAKSVPDLLQGLLSEEQFENLACALTVPYLRLPLVVDFFASADRVDLLRSRELQRLLNGVLFEPGRLDLREIAEPGLVPRPGGVRSSSGALLAELSSSPAAVLDPMLRLVQHVLAMAAGSSHNSACVDVVLFVVRLLVALESFVCFLANRSTSALESKYSAIDEFLLPYVSPAVLAQLQKYNNNIRELLEKPVIDQLFIWARKSLPRDIEVQACPIMSPFDLPSAVSLHAHVALCFANLPPISSHLGFEVKSTGGAKLIADPSISSDVADFVNEQPSERALRLSLGALTFFTAWYGGSPASQSDANPEAIGNTSSEDRDTAELIEKELDKPLRTTTQSKVHRPRRVLKALPAIQNPVPESFLYWLLVMQAQARVLALRSLAPRARAQIINTAVISASKRICVADVLPTSTVSQGVGHMSWEELSIAKDNNEFCTRGVFSGSDQSGSLGAMGVRDVANLTTFNAQTCQVAHGRQVVEPVSASVASHPDFIAAFGSKPQHWCLLESRMQARKYSLFGAPNLELTVWTGAPSYAADAVPLLGEPEPLTSSSDNPGCSDEARHWVCFSEVEGALCSAQNDIKTRRCAACKQLKPVLSLIERYGCRWTSGEKYSRRYGSEPLREGEEWLCDLLEPVLNEVFGGKDKPDLKYSLWMPTSPLPPHAHVARLIGFSGSVWLEWQVLRAHRLVQTFVLKEFDRRVCRSLIYSSDSRFALRALSSNIHDRESSWNIGSRYAAGNVHEGGGTKISCVSSSDKTISPPFSQKTWKNEYCVISRRIVLAGTLVKQTFIPSQFLFGLLPATLLEDYLFWKQNLGDAFLATSDLKASPRFSCLRGYSRVSEETSSQSSRARSTELHVYFSKSLHGEVVARVTRISTCSQTDSACPCLRSLAENVAHKTSSEARPNGDNSMLVNLLYAQPNSLASRLAELLVRLDNLSHILVWARNTTQAFVLGGENQSDIQDVGELDIVELPRLRLAFSPRLNSRQQLLLYSQEHSGWFINESKNQLETDSLQRLCYGIPHYIILENASHEFALLIPATRVFRPLVPSCPFSTELVLHRNDKLSWQGALGQSNFLYRVHSSFLSILPSSLVSSLYLVTLMLLARRYSEAMALVQGCEVFTKFDAAEQAVFQHIEQSLNDKHPDAIAVRLKLYLCLYHSENPVLWKSSDLRSKSFDVKWSLAVEYSGYITKSLHVSACCRLSFKEECLILDRIRDTDGEFLSFELANR